MVFDGLNIPTAAQKYDISSMRFWCHWKGVFLRRIPSVMIPEKTLAGRWAHAQQRHKKLESDQKNTC